MLQTKSKVLWLPPETKSHVGLIAWIIRMSLCPPGKSAVWLLVADEAVNNWENVNRD